MTIWGVGELYSDDLLSERCSLTGEWDGTVSGISIFIELHDFTRFCHIRPAWLSLIALQV